MLRDPLLFGDYRNALDEEEIRYYEDLLDYEAVYFLFQEVTFCMSVLKIRKNVISNNAIMLFLNKQKSYLIFGI